ncbi:MAG: cupin domain-containing protein [Zoogloeaceae bacterium]|nr:cupin domain-containing protein [Zoogloeaceae bacterium]
MLTTLLGGLTPAQFLADYWQKKPLLIRQAIPSFTGTLSKKELFDLARSPDVESRLIRHTESDWSVTHGPQRAADLKGKRDPWTVLVQGVNLFVPAADELLHSFDFIPQARLDDLMVSYAVDGGGVGPHFDHYDVFLLQGMGRRRWRIGIQADRSLIEGAPLRILKHFAPTEDWILEPGDMLYLPPHYAHDGVAVGECMTYSIGFRTPTGAELGQQFLAYLQDHLCLEDVYSDPDLAPPEHSAEIGPDMVAQVAGMLEKIRWDRNQVADFLGRTLTEPKAHVFFEPPEEPLSRRAFGTALKKHGFRLDARSILLFQGACFYLNGEPVEIAAGDARAVRELADRRALPAGAAWNGSLGDCLYEWYCNGFGGLG